MVLIIAMIGAAWIAVLVRPDKTMWVPLAAVSLYLIGVRELGDDFFRIPAPTPVNKLVTYVWITAPLFTAVWIQNRRKTGRLALALLLTYVSLLPLSAPAEPFLRDAQAWQASLFPERFRENISRIQAKPQDAEWLRDHCAQLDDSTNRLLWARVRNIPGAVMPKNCLLSSVRAGIEANPFQELSTTEILAHFSSSREPELKASLLDEMRRRRSPDMTAQAVKALGDQPDVLIVASVRYLRVISGEQIGNDPERWDQWLHQRSSNMVVQTISFSPSTEIGKRGYSAIKALDDLYTAREENKDFLRVHLHKHFPRKITTEDIDLLRHASLEECANPSCYYRKAMMSLFLALAESRLLAEGMGGNAVQADQDWKLTKNAFAQAGQLGVAFREELEPILTQSDENHDGSLDQQELIRMIRSRLK